MGRCVCGHPADFHGDRAVSVCVLWDAPPNSWVTSYFMGKLDTFPMCPTCTGYQEDLRDLYLQRVRELASRAPLSSIAGAPLAS